MHTEHAGAAAPNHHRDHPGFSGLGAHLVGLTMTVGRGPAARLAAELTNVAPGDHVVDVGCGPGTAARHAARLGATVTGIDPSTEMRRLARWLTAGRRAIAPSITWTDGRAELLPLPDEFADVLWSLATVHHWPDLDSGIAEARRVLRPGGRFLAMERRTHAGATGLASHGWVAEQAEAFAERLRDAGFDEVRAALHHAGRSAQLAVLGVRW